MTPATFRSPSRRTCLAASYCSRDLSSQTQREDVAFPMQPLLLLHVSPSVPSFSYLSPPCSPALCKRQVASTHDACQGKLVKRVATGIMEEAGLISWLALAPAGHFPPISGAAATHPVNAQMTS